MSRQEKCKASPTSHKVRRSLNGQKDAETTNVLFHGFKRGDAPDNDMLEEAPATCQPASLPTSYVRALPDPGATPRAGERRRAEVRPPGPATGRGRPPSEGCRPDLVRADQTSP